MKSKDLKFSFDLKNLKHFLKRVGTDPYTDWAIVFSFGTILSLIFILFATFIFIRIHSGNLFVVDKPKEIVIPILDRVALHGIIKHFDQKKANYENARRVLPTLADPSL